MNRLKDIAITKRRIVGS